jgi:hypothetical protein
MLTRDRYVYVQSGVTIDIRVSQLLFRYRDS